MRIAAPAESIRTCRAMASGRFGHFKPETEKKNRQADIRKGPALKRILEAWHSIDLDSPSGSLRCGRATIEIYDTVADRLSGINARQTDIDAFIAYLKVRESDHHDADKAGLFLSALVNTGCQKSYRIDLRGMAQLNQVAFRNCKRITVQCYKGEYFASYNAAQVTIRGNVFGVAIGQTGGKTVVHGDCIHVATKLMGGEVIVLGSAENVGFMMQGGRVDIKGRVEPVIDENHIQFGEAMEGGEISVNSYDTESVDKPHPYGGRIIIAGFLFFENGHQLLPFVRNNPEGLNSLLEHLEWQRKAGSHL